MKIYIETFTGTGQTYKFDIESSTTIRQLKEILLKKLGDNKDLQTKCFRFNEKLLENDNQTLLDYDIQDSSILELIDLSGNTRDDCFFGGINFVDISNKKGLKRQIWSKTAPSWRRTIHGLCLEGICTNQQCEANQQQVIIPIGYKKFDMLVDTNETTTICPICKNYVEPQTCAFNNCWWKYEGIKQDEIGKPPKKCSCDWQYADNAYHYFDQQTSDINRWKQLIFQVVEDTPEL